MATPPPASDKTIKDTTKTVVEANASVAEAATGTTDAVKSGVKATQQTGAAVVKAVSDVGKAVGTPPVINVTVPPTVIPVPPIDTSLKDISKQLMSAMGSLAYEKTVGRVMGALKVFSPLGKTIDDLKKGPLWKWKPGETMAKMGQGFLGKLNKFKGGEAAVSSQMEKALQKIGKGNVDLVSMTSSQRKSTLKQWSKEGKDTGDLHKLLIGEGKEKEGKLDQAQLQAGAELVGEREQGDILAGRKDERIEGEVDVAKGEVKGEEKEGEKKEGGDTPVALNSMSLLGKMVESLEALQDIQANMLNIMVDDSAAAAEAAAEAARKNLGKGDGGIKDAKVQEAKAGGFFSRMGGAIMNPMKAMGSGMKKIGKGIQGILTGIARGLMAFANPLVLVGVTFLAISLPILAAGLAAAFKVFDMIAGKGAALEILTGIISALGGAIGGILKDILEGIGLFIAASGDGLLAFMKGLAIIIKSLTPIIAILIPMVNALMAALTAILTSEAFNKTLQVIVNKVGDLLIAFLDFAKVLGPALEALFNGVGTIVTVIGNVVIAVINAVMLPIKIMGDIIIAVIENIGAIIDSVGKAVSAVIDSVGGVIKVIGDVIIGVIDAIAAAISKTIDSIVGGIERLSKLDGGNMLVVAAALLALGAALAVFAVGAAIGGAFMPSKEQLESMANSISKFGDIDATNFNMVGAGIKSIGEGLLAFGGGSFIAGLADAFGKWIGATDPVEKFQKFAKIGPGLDLAAKGIDGLGEAMKRFEKTMKALDLSKVDEVAEGMAKIRDASDPGALAKLGGMVSSVAGAATAIWGGDKKEAVEAGADAHSIPAMIAETNRLIEQGFITGPSGLFGSPGIGTSAFMMARTGQKQLTTAESQLKTAEETKVVAEKEIKSPVLTKVEIPKLEKFKFEPVKMDIPKLPTGRAGIAARNKANQVEVAEQKEQEYKWERVGRSMKRVPVETLDTTAATSLTPQTGPSLVAGQMEANALATAGATPSTITDASSSTIVNNSNQSMMMPLPDPNPHNMDFRPEERLFPS